jgi:hypothetical protein
MTNYAVRLVAFGVLCLLGGYLIVGQWVGGIQSMRKQRNYSPVPLLGGGLAAIGIAVAPWPAVRTFWWLPPIVDPGCLGVLFLPFYLVWYWISKNSKRRPRGDTSNP